MNASEPDESNPTSGDHWTFHPGDDISGRYQIVDRLGQGAFGEVHAARDLETGRRVAIKILQTDSVERDPMAVARMRQEAEILRALDHPNLVQVYDMGSVDGHEYLVMELLEGRSLDDLIEAGEVAPPERLRPLVAQILSALEAMHRRDVQHRDIKPDNIILLEDEDGGETVKLVDFGIAKARDFLDGDHEFTLVQTQEDEFVGTPRYTAPEQAVGDPVGPGGDLFSLGLVAAEWLTGTPRIKDAGERGALSILIQPEPIDVSDCPTSWQPWLVRMVAKKPEERYSSVREALEELPGLDDPDAWIESPSAPAIDDEDPTAPLRRDPAPPAAERAQPAHQIGEPGDPLEPTKVKEDDPPGSNPERDGYDDMSTLDARPAHTAGPPESGPPESGPPESGPPIGEPRHDGGAHRRSTVLPDEQTTDRGRTLDRGDQRTDDLQRNAPEAEELDDSTLFWTIAAAIFFIASLAVFLYTVLTV